jgi:hypothetical protein
MGNAISPPQCRSLPILESGLWIRRLSLSDEDYLMRSHLPDSITLSLFLSRNDDLRFIFLRRTQHVLPIKLHSLLCAAIDWDRDWTGDGGGGGIDQLMQLKVVAQDSQDKAPIDLVAFQREMNIV